MIFFGLYKQYLYPHPRKVLTFYVVILFIAALFSTRFELDASPESLVLENDESLNYYREISQRYASDDFVVITFTPHSGELLSDESLAVITSMRDKLLALDNIVSVTSILDVPIIYQTEYTLSELSDNLQSLEQANVEKALARKEFMTNPLYRDLLVSTDGKTAAIQALFIPDAEYYQLLDERLALIKLGDQQAIAAVSKKIRAKNKEFEDLREVDIKLIRAIIDEHREHGQFYLGGIPMITVDMIQFIKNDLVVFGTGVLLFLVLILSLFFRVVRWVMLPLLICASTGLLAIGFLGMMGWSVTVISSNFLSILLIITLSLTIHIIVRYRDLQLQDTSATHQELILQTVASMSRPCFYTILTTAVAFASLVVSEIRPVIDFGWIMVAGLIIAFIVSFSVMPAILSLLGDAETPPARDITRTITLSLASLVHRFPRSIVMVCTLLLFGIGSGIMLLKVENRFINNFKSHTEIYQGMKVIDEQLGGTMPLDIIIDPDQAFLDATEELAQQTSELDELFMDEGDTAEEPTYWLHPKRLAKAQQIQAYLEANPVIGKVVSLVSSVNIVEKLNRAPLDEFELAVLRKRIPESISDDLIEPYLSDDSNQTRFNMRIIESDPKLNRKQLLHEIRSYVIDDLGFDAEQVHLTGMMVLYNNMLQSLYRSQILTIGAVFGAIFLMFVVLFRNLSLALIAIIPNIFSAALILGLMGLLSIPLDMMTITIAAITIGISVDNTIHYIHRFQKEFPKDKDYLATVNRCHGGIGKAMYYTSMAIIFGFAILAFSNFIPTIYFGLLTGFAMFLALVGDLLLLPAIVLLTRPRID